MPTTLSWLDVVMRLGLASVVGLVIGFNRGQHGRAAGLRTMLLVCTSAALAMVLANYIEIAELPRSSNGPLRMDPLRIPLGILSGIGFLGAGAILRRGDLIRGVTTAATMWYVTVLGLCFGSGHWAVGLGAWGVALFALFVLPHAETRIHSDRYCAVTVVTRAEGLSEDELRRRLEALQLEVLGFNIDYQVTEKLKTIKCMVRYHVGRTFDLPQQVIAELSHRPGVIEVKWK